MKVAFFLLSVLSLSAARAVRDDNLDAYLKEILELLKAQMPAGIPDLGIPPLDPFEVPHFDIDPIEEDIIKATIEINNLVIKNLATFETKIAHLDLEALSLELELTIADLRGDADYKLDGTIASILPLYGEGPMWLEIYGLDVYAKAAVLINAEGFVEITEIDLTADLTDIKMHLDNLLGGGNFGESINNLLNVVGGYIWDQVKDLLFPLLDEVLLKVINDALKGCNIADLIANGSCFQDRMKELGRAGQYLKL
eukprot:TRINITY_DN2597_c0_g1_i14.p1 TRINITY_DN2597_c0_g1~~TRINITY_DN2597_c0_g1_i14.p1  ORF type:complete len:254 (-),score=101.37 TRINITY_DN2597_c0_g1_i14:40-801(-)